MILSGKVLLCRARILYLKCFQLPSFLIFFCSRHFSYTVIYIYIYFIFFTLFSSLSLIYEAYLSVSSSFTLHCSSCFALSLPRFPFFIFFCLLTDFCNCFKTKSLLLEGAIITPSLSNLILSSLLWQLCRNGKVPWKMHWLKIRQAPILCSNLLPL